MNLARRLTSALADPALPGRLTRLAAGTAASTPLTLSLALGAGPTDGLALLPADADYWYWSRPADGEWCLALGTVLHYETAGSERFAALAHAWAGLTQAWRREGDGLAFFGFAFTGDQAADPLPNTRLALPALTLRRRQGATTALLTCTAGEAHLALDRWRALIALPQPDTPLPSQHRQPAELGEQAWQAGVQAALRAIDAGHLDKVVLARSIRLLADGPIGIRPLLAALGAGHPACTLYATGNARHAFLGATPERLIRLRAGRAEADALAGTAWPGSDDPALTSDKNRREQAFVAAAVAEALGGLCDDLTMARPEPLALGELSHLRAVVGGTPRPGIGLFQLADALHPTPAVGGSPRGAALAWLRERQEKRPAWYSGGIGWIDAACDGEVAVALRCAMVAGNQALLTAGAGIVAGSDPTQELAETEAKLAVLGDLLQAPLRHPRTGTA